MAINQDNATQIVKAPANAVTYQRTAAVTGLAAIGPQIVEPVVEWGTQILHALVPVIPEPSVGALWGIANLICAIPVGVLAWRMRGNTVQPSN
ncbi:MAG: hypothetical protein E6Q98_16130 [Rhodospirillaceae bacterium]|nr:MAG: hypothetical protein E6Q98_16130 [Rhodospirillaceae bacterium]